MLAWAVVFVAIVIVCTPGVVSTYRYHRRVSRVQTGLDAENNRSQVTRQYEEIAAEVESWSAPNLELMREEARKRAEREVVEERRERMRAQLEELYSQYFSPYRNYEDTINRVKADPRYEAVIAEHAAPDGMGAGGADGLMALIEIQLKGQVLGASAYRYLPESRPDLALALARPPRQSGKSIEMWRHGGVVR